MYFPPTYKVKITEN